MIHPPPRYRWIAAILLAGFASSCGLLSTPDCTADAYCENNVAVDWSGYPEGDFFPACEVEEEDCSLDGRTCLEDVIGSGVGCYYPELTCPPSVSSYCINDVQIICDRIAALAEEKIDCAAEGMGCATLNDTEATCAPVCENEGITCEYNWGAQYSECRNGHRFDLTCPLHHICVSLDMNNTWQDRCVIDRHKCGFDTDPIAPFCEGNQRHDSCRTDETGGTAVACSGGCGEFADELGQIWVVCDTDTGVAGSVL